MFTATTTCLMPEQREQIAVPPRLLAHAFIRRDEQHRGIRAGRAGDHVLQELLVARRVDDDVGARGRLELNLRRVDRDVLLLLLEQRIEQEGVLELHPLLADSRLDLLDLAVGQRLGVVENATDERGLAVIDVADEDDAEMRFERLRCVRRSRRVMGQSYMNPFARSFCMALRS